MTGPGRCHLVAGLMFASAMSLTLSAARAHTPCDPTLMLPVPDCEIQTMAPVHYGSWGTSGWAYYCTGDHPYYWGIGSDYLANFTWDSDCFTVAENYYGETTPFKFDATITNWCINPGGQDIVVSLGCSDKPPPGFLPSCPGGGEFGPDPGCPQSNVSTYCTHTVPAICFLTFFETCSNNVEYSCYADNGLTQCQTCQ